MSKNFDLMLFVIRAAMTLLGLVIGVVSADMFCATLELSIMQTAYASAAIGGICVTLTQIMYWALSRNGQ